MFIEIALIGTLTVNTLSHEQEHKPHVPLVAYETYLSTLRGGGYVLSAMVESALALSWLSGYVLTISRGEPAVPPTV